MPSRNVFWRVLFAGAVIVILLETSRPGVRGDDAAGAPRPIRSALPVTRPAPDPRAVSDGEVQAAITKGAEFLLAQFKDGQVTQGADVSPAFHQGLDALCVYALLSAGQATQDPRLMPRSDAIRRSIDEMKMHAMATDRDRPKGPVVYARSLRAAALAAYALPEDAQSLRDDVQWLVDASVDGAYGYDDRVSGRVIHNPLPPGNRRSPLGNAGSPGVRPFFGGGVSPAGPVVIKPVLAASPAGPVGRSPNPWNPPPGGDKRGSKVVITYTPAPPRIPVTPGRSTGGTPGGPKPPPPPAAKPAGPNVITAPPPVPLPPYPPQELPDPTAGPFVWDNSNSEYGFFGVLCGVGAGFEVPDAYFREVQGHWMSCQLRTGEWSYRRGHSVGYLAMTCAGVASLTAAHEQLRAADVARVGRRRDDVDAALGRALEWLARGDKAVTVDGAKKVYVGYTLFNLERVGLATGYKYLGGHEWYPELAHKVVACQSANGSWGKSDQPTADTLIDTAYSVLFLSRGRHPVMMNKLQLDPPGRSDHGEWDNRPRDLANLAAFASRELERPVQWQVVPLDRDPADWSDAPILYLASNAALKLSDAEVAKLRTFIDAGGMLFTQADDGAPGFNLYVDQLAKRLYADRAVKELPRDHEIYTLQYQIPFAKRPRLRGMSDAAGRLVWVHSPTDLAVSWQQRAVVTKREAFELGVNLFAFAAGKGDLRHRLEPRAIPAPSSAPAATLSLARVNVGGLWDPWPGAFPRFGRHLYDETSLALATVSATPVEINVPGAPRLAHLYLPSGATLADADAAALRQFVTSGGTLIVESPGATSPGAARPRMPVNGDHLGSALAGVFPDARFEPVTESHPVVSAAGPGMEKVWPLKVRPYVTKSVGDEVPPVRVAEVGKGRVVHLPLDVSNGLLGCAEWGVMGYEPATAQALVKNVLLWSSSR